MSPAASVLEIRRMDGGSRLVVHHPETIARAFFDWDQGSRLYDAQANDGAEPNRMTRQDLRAINSLIARSPVSAWAAILEQEQPWLAAIDPAWELFSLDDSTWHAEAVPNLRIAFEALTGPYLGLAVVTKMLHLKRPRLMPILDSLVLDLIGGHGHDRIEVVDHIRHVGRDNATTLEAMARALAAAGHSRTPVRILDALIWSLHPGAGIAPKMRLNQEVSWRTALSEDPVFELVSAPRRSD